MTKKSVSLAFFFVTLAVLNAVAAGAGPNVILCMTDDQGWGDTGYNGHALLTNPPLDKMRREGVTLSRF